MIIIGINNRNHEVLDFATSNSLQEMQHSTESDSSLYGNKFPIFEDKIQENELRQHKFDGIFGSPSVQDGQIIHKHGKALTKLGGIPLY
jgi:hypothetical protein